MFGFDSSKKFIVVSRHCYQIVANLTILNMPDDTGKSSVAQSVSDEELEYLKSQCPDLFNLAAFYYQNMPDFSTSTLFKFAKNQSIDNPEQFFHRHMVLIRNLKSDIYSWLAIPENKRIQSLAKRIPKHSAPLPPIQAAQELDHSVRNLEVTWVDKSDLFSK